MKQDILACLLLALATACAFRSWLFEGRALYWGDIGLYFLPMSAFARAELLRGIVPLWNPHLLCGAPYFGDPQVWPLYPSSSLAALFSSEVYLTFVCALHIYLAGLFFYFLLRYSRLKSGVLPSLCGALCYMFGGYVVSKAQFPNMLQALSYVPLSLLLAERLALRPSLGRALLLGAILGLQVLAAHAQVSLLTLYLAGAYALWQWRAAGAERAPIVRLGGWSCVAAAVALGLSCGQWLPTAQLVRYAERQTLTLGAANRFYLRLDELPNFFWPFRLGSPMHGNWHTPGNFWEVACFVGIVPFLLALYALARIKASPNPTGFWLIALLASLWLALGRQACLYILVFYLLPGVSAFHDPARFLLGVAVALPILAAAGLQDIQRRLKNRRVSIAFGIATIAVAAVTLGWYDHDLIPLKPAAEIEGMANASIPSLLRTDHALATSQGRVFMADPYKTWVYFTSYKRYAQNDPGFLSHWADTMTPNLGITLGLDQAGGYEPEGLRSSRVISSRAESWAAPAQDKRFVPSRNGDLTSLLSQMSVRDVVVYRVDPLIAPGLSLIAKTKWHQDDNSVWAYQNQDFLPRAREYTNWAFSGETALPSGVLQFLEATDSGPDQVEISVPPSASPRLLVLADTSYPGWQVRVDSRPASLVAVDPFFRGVALPPNPPGSKATRQVIFRYRPEVFMVGLYITLLTCSLLAGAASASLIRNKWQTRGK